MKECCENCRYFDDYKHIAIDRDSDYDGYCKRYPKELNKDDSDWCGEWKTKTKEGE